MLEIIIGLAVALITALGWGKFERDGRKREQRRAEQADRIIDIHNRVRDEDRAIDERMRAAEGADDEERDHRLRNPRDY